MGAVLFVIALVVAGAPIGATVLVSVASRREDRDWTLRGTAPGTTEAAARRIVDFHSEGVWPWPKSRPELGPASVPAMRARAGTPARERALPPMVVTRTASAPDAR